MYVGTSSPRCKSFKSNVGLLFLNEMLHPVIVALQIGRLDGEIRFKKWVILAAWCPSPPFFVFRHVRWEDIKTYFQNWLVLALPTSQKRRGIAENNMQIPRFPNTLKMQKQIWLCCWVGISVFVQLQLYTWGKYKKGLNELLNMCDMERLKYTINENVNCKTPGLFIRVNRDLWTLIMRFCSQLKSGFC